MGINGGGGDCRAEAADPAARMRYTRQCGEADLEPTPAAIAGGMPGGAERMVRGVSTRDYRAWWSWPAKALGCESRASAVPSWWRRPKRCGNWRSGASTRALSGDLLDSVVYAEESMTVALGAGNGCKRVLGVVKGPRKRRVCTALLEDLQQRGLDTSSRRCWCWTARRPCTRREARLGATLDPTLQVHKKRNVRDTSREALGRAFAAAPRAYNETTTTKP